MTKYKSKGKKIRLAKRGRRTKWAPFWIIPKINGKPKKIHPSRYTKIKRNWRRSSSIRP